MKDNKKTNAQNDSVKLTLEKRSEEVDDIIERMPTIWTNIVVAIITVIIVVMLTLACVISYPDTVRGRLLSLERSRLFVWSHLPLAA